MFLVSPRSREVVIAQSISNLARFVHRNTRLTHHASRDSFGHPIANQCSLHVEVKA
jgi:hypothetical protein